MLKKINKIKRLKLKRKLVCLTAYSTPISKILDNHCDIVLVGDSMATAFYGMENTKSINLKTIINHAIAVKRGSKKSTVVVDMPINTYKSFNIAKRNVANVFKQTKCDAVKLESDGKNFAIIRRLVNLGFPIMGHIGYTPQNKSKFKPQGLKKNEEKKLIEEALEIEKAGAFSMVLECIGEQTSKKITKVTNIPTIGIGSSKFCDGQILVTDDLIGISGFKPKFVKKYINLKKILEKTFFKFKMDVLNHKFPARKNSFN